VNRLGMMSMLLGLAVLVTGYYGMNIPHLENVLHNDRISF
jgi:Mg2+ and Co2+ transporter CorA